jgi:hypothetical protein
MNKPGAGRTSSELRRVADLLLARAGANGSRHRQRSWAPPHASTAQQLLRTRLRRKGAWGSRAPRMLRSYRSGGELCYTAAGMATTHRASISAALSNFNALDCTSPALFD